MTIDPGVALFGFLLIGLPWLGWQILSRKIRNPYGVQLYWFRFPQYAVWSAKHHSGEPLLFLKGDMVRWELSLVDAKGYVYMVEPNDGRETWVPRSCLQPASKLAAWWYYKLHQWEKAEKARAGKEVS